MQALHPFSLTFKDTDLERQYSEATRKRTLHQGRAAILVGVFVYLLCGLVDFGFAPAEVIGTNWSIRIAALAVPLLVLALSYTPVFRNYGQALLVAVCTAAGVGIIGIQSQVGEQNAAYYYPAIILLTFYTYNFIGVRFVYALFVDVFLLLGYNLWFAYVMDYPLAVLLTHDIYIVSANLIGATSGYLAERQRRIIFQNNLELEEERRFHHRRSIHDPMTGLPNRELLYDRMRQTMARGQRDHSRHCGIFIDLDGFKAINDSLGHEVGDQVLRLVASRLASAVREQDTVARIGGDEFFVIALDVPSREAAQTLGEKLLATVSEPLTGEAQGHKLTASVGICEFPYPGMTIEGIIRCADQAMYGVKHAGKSDFEFADGSFVRSPAS